MPTWRCRPIGEVEVEGKDINEAVKKANEQTYYRSAGKFAKYQCEKVKD